MSDLANLLDRLENHDASDLRGAAAFELRRLADKRALPALRRRLVAERDLKARAAVVGALGATGDETDVDRLIPLYKRLSAANAGSLEAMLRDTIITALDSLGAQSALGFLREVAAQGADADLRRRANEAADHIEAKSQGESLRSSQPAPAAAQPSMPSASQSARPTPTPLSPPSRQPSPRSSRPETKPPSLPNYRLRAILAGAACLTLFLIFTVFWVSRLTQPPSVDAAATAALMAHLAPETEKAEAAFRSRQTAQHAAAVESARYAHGRGGLSVRSDPDYANIAINDHPFASEGGQPYVISGLRFGKYIVSASRDGFEDGKVEVDLNEARMAEVVVKLTRSTGRLELTTTPDHLPVHIRLHWSASSDAHEGFSPLELTSPIAVDLPTAYYTVTVKRDGFDDYERDVKVNRGETAVESIEVIGGRLEIVSTPAGAEIFENDERIGATPYTVAEARPGYRHLQLRLEGYKTAALDFGIGPGVTTHEEVTLKELDAPEAGDP